MSDYSSLYKSAWRKKAAKKDAKKSMSRAKALAKWRARPSGPLNYANPKEDSELKVCEYIKRGFTTQFMNFMDDRDDGLQTGQLGRRVNSYWYPQNLVVGAGGRLGGFLTTSGVGDLIDPEDVLYCLNAIGCGPGISQRIGRRIEMQSLHFRVQVGCRELWDRYKVGVDQAMDTVPSSCPCPIVRCVVVYDRQPNGLIPNAQDVFARQEYFDINQSSTQKKIDPRAGINVGFKDRFAVLSDNVCAFPPVESTMSQLDGTVSCTGMRFLADPIGRWLGSPNECAALDVFVPLNGLETVFKSDPGPGQASGADIATGGLYLFMFTNIDRQYGNPMDDGFSDNGLFFWDASVRLVYSDK